MHSSQSEAWNILRKVKPLDNMYELKQTIKIEDIFQVTDGVHING
jgi:hypothetical protein